jgi:hypothetical protein
LAQLKTIKLKALNRQKMVGFEPDIPTRKAVDKILKEQGVKVEYVAQFRNHLEMAVALFHRRVPKSSQFCNFQMRATR